MQMNRLMLSAFNPHIPQEQWGSMSEVTNIHNRTSLDLECTANTRGLTKCLSKLSGHILANIH
uniref:SFRICE_030223 n=1 Tax=Spodoptera frugiperda TaxID=7108 RepID=A0A2H1W8X2_SPOFR